MKCFAKVTSQVKGINIQKKQDTIFINFQSKVKVDRCGQTNKLGLHGT
jgi:hypothetical protein